MINGIKINEINVEWVTSVKTFCPLHHKKAGLVREYLEFSREQTPDSNRSTSSSPSRESIPRSSGYLYEPHVAAREFASQSRYA